MTVPAPHDLAAPAPGTLLAGKYSVTRVLGKGGMGVVVEAHHLRLQQSVAIKLLNPEVRAMREVNERFAREARAAARLTGPHVARILDVDALPDGTPFMVMEMLRGHELADELADRGPLPIAEAVGYVLQACAGMAEAHRAGIVHRDLKPQNLFLCESEGQRTIKVLDFGISKLTGDIAASVTQTETAFGTPLYMSPEQVRSAKHVDARADIWSLGVVLYELIAGVSPFAHPSATAILAAIIADQPVPLRKRRPEAPAALAAAVAKALEKDPNDRYADVRDFAAAIAPFGPSRDEPMMAAVVAELSNAGAAAPALTVAFGTSGERGPSRAMVIAAGVLGAAAALATFVALRGRKPPPVEPPQGAPAAVTAVTAAPTGPVVVPAESAAAPPASVEPPAASATPQPSARRKPPAAGSARPSAPAPRPPTAAPKAADDPKYL